MFQGSRRLEKYIFQFYYIVFIFTYSYAHSTSSLLFSSVCCIFCVAFFKRDGIIFMKKMMAKIWVTRIGVYYIRYRFLRMLFGLLGCKKQAAYNGVLHSKNLSLLFYPLAKNGCSFAKNLIFSGKSDNYMNDRLIHKSISESVYFFRRDDSSHLPSASKRATIVRNPFVRFVSFYKDKFEQGRSDDFHFYLLRKYYFNKLNPCQSFEEVVDFCCDTPDQVSDIHFQSQSYSLRSVDFHALDIFKLEEMSEFYSYVDNLNGGDNISASRGKVNCMESYDYRDYYDLNTYKKIFNRYSEDIVNFDYLSEAEELYSYLKHKEKNE